MPTEKNKTATAGATEAPDPEPTSPWNPESSEDAPPGSFMPIIQETAINTLAYAAIDRIFRKHSVFSANNVAFLGTDLGYEMFESRLSGMMNSIVDMSKYTTVPTSAIGVGDFGDAKSDPKASQK